MCCTSHNSVCIKSLVFKNRSAKTTAILEGNRWTIKRIHSSSGEIRTFASRVNSITRVSRFRTPPFRRYALLLRKCARVYSLLYTCQFRVGRYPSGIRTLALIITGARAQEEVIRYFCRANAYSETRHVIQVVYSGGLFMLREHRLNETFVRGKIHVVYNTDEKSSIPILSRLNKNA